jgi:hypothetical protein
METEKWAMAIPVINFNSKWQVRNTPPMGGVVVRFLVSFNEKQVSVYLDCYKALGTCSHPYWRHTQSMATQKGLT